MKNILHFYMVNNKIIKKFTYLYEIKLIILLLAVLTGDNHLVKLLIDHHSDVNVDIHGITGLMKGIGNSLK
jgi:hypothetical protein